MDMFGLGLKWILFQFLGLEFWIWEAYSISTMSDRYLSIPALMYNQIFQCTLQHVDPHEWQYPIFSHSDHIFQTLNISVRHNIDFCN